MAEIFFVIKTFLITCVVVYCLQFKIGDQTADEQLNAFLQKGTLTKILRDAGQGATRLTASAIKQAKEGQFKSPLSKIGETENIKKKFEDNEMNKMKRLESLEDEAYQDSVDEEPAP